MKSREVSFKRLRLTPTVTQSDERFHTISLSSVFFAAGQTSDGAPHAYTAASSTTRTHERTRSNNTHTTNVRSILRPCDVEEGAHRASGKRQQALMTRRRGVRTPLEARSTRNARGDERVLSEGAVLEVACTQRGEAARQLCVRLVRVCVAVRARRVRWARHYHRRTRRSVTSSG